MIITNETVVGMRRIEKKKKKKKRKKRVDRILSRSLTIFRIERLIETNPAT